MYFTLIKTYRMKNCNTYTLTNDCMFGLDIVGVKIQSDIQENLETTY